MKLYLAGIKEKHSTELMAKKGVNKLVSYAYPKQLSTYCQAIKELEPSVKGNLMIDSGAFSFWSNNQRINIDSYLKYLENTLKFYTQYFNEISYVNLDVIPGQKGRNPTPSEMEKSAEEGWRNYHYMKERGFNSIHVFHAGEPFYWLDIYMKECDYIGISPSNQYSTEQKREWLNETFGYICDKEGKPQIKTHGFAVTIEEFLYLYPFYSVDSASWSIQSGFGGVKTPFGNFCVSSRQSEKIAGRLKKQPQIVQEQVEKWLNSLGYTVTDIEFSYKKRDEINILFFLELERKVSEKEIRYTNKQKDFFHLTDYDSKYPDLQGVS